MAYKSVDIEKRKKRKNNKNVQENVHYNACDKETDTYIYFFDCRI